MSTLDVSKLDPPRGEPVPAGRRRVKDLDVLALSDAAYERWLAQTWQFQERKPRRRLSQIYYSRSHTSFFRARQVWEGDQLVEHAWMLIRPVLATHPRTGQTEAMLVALCNRGALSPRYTGTQLRTQVIRWMSEFHLRGGAAGREVFLLVVSGSPATSSRLARTLPAVHPSPGRHSPGMERLRADLVGQLFPQNVEEYWSGRRFTAPPSRQPEVMPGELGRLTQGYLQLHGGWGPEANLPLVARLMPRELLGASWRSLIFSLAVRLGLLSPVTAELRNPLPALLSRIQQALSRRFHRLTSG